MGCCVSDKSEFSAKPESTILKEVEPKVEIIEKPVVEKQHEGILKGEESAKSTPKIKRVKTVTFSKNEAQSESKVEVDLVETQLKQQKRQEEQELEL